MAKQTQVSTKVLQLRFFFFLLNFWFCTEVEPINNVVIVLGQQ